MTNFIFKSANRLIKNSPLTEGFIMTKLENIQKELRHQRQDNKDIKLMLNKLLIDKHLQTQVDDFFKSPPTPPPTQGLSDPDYDIPQDDRADLD